MAEHENQEFQQGDKMIKPVIPTVAIIAVVLCVICGIGYYSVQMFKMDRMHTLMTTKTWERHELEGTSIYTLEMDFSESSVDYNFDAYLLPKTTLAAYDYKILDGETVLFITEFGTEIEIKVTFNDDENKMTFEPALTSTDASETWTVYDER